MSNFNEFKKKKLALVWKLRCSAKSVLLENTSSNTQISCNAFQMQSGKSQPMIRSSVVAVFVVNTVPLWGLNVCVSKE